MPDDLGLPLIVKPPREGSSIGVTKVAGLLADAGRGRRWRRATTPTCCASSSSSGDEVTCPVLGSGDDARALPVIRIVAPEGNYDYQNKYFTDDTQVPSARAACPTAEEQAIQRIVAGGLPRARLPRLGPRRPDDPRAATASPSCSR